MPAANDHFIRIAVRLLAMAVLAERAGERSRPVCWLVLWILRRAESVAHAYLPEVSPFVPADFEAVCDGPDHAMRLAMRFRALAAVFFALAEDIAPAPRWAHDPICGVGRLSWPTVSRRSASVPARRSRAPPAALSRRGPAAEAFCHAGFKPA